MSLLSVVLEHKKEWIIFLFGGFGVCSTICCWRHQIQTLSHFSILFNPYVCEWNIGTWQEKKTKTVVGTALAHPMMHSRQGGKSVGDLALQAWLYKAIQESRRRGSSPHTTYNLKNCIFPTLSRLPLSYSFLKIPMSEAPRMECRASWSEASW